MLVLLFFGRDVEDLYGPREFLTFYLVAALVGGLAFTLTWAVGLSGGVCLGASGAMTAVLVLSAIHFPTRTVLLFFVLPVPIWLFVIGNIALDSFVFLGQINTGTAVTVHLGGAAFALLYYKRHWRLMNLWDGLRSWLQQRTRPRLRVYREEPSRAVPATAPPIPDAEEQLEAKLDAVLEKVARYGQSSLTENERQILLRASEIYKRRRS
jgi:hypothetical protein